MQYPIYIYSSRTEKEEVDESDKTIDSDTDELKAEDESTEAAKKTVEKTVYYWKRLNKNKPLWTRRPNSITDEEYTDFYKAFTRDTEEPLSWKHFRAEGEIEFDSILYIPKKAPHGMYDNYYNQKSTLRLYVRRVLVADEFEDIIPRYLNFIKGLVDSNDLPLNVNREDLQKNKIMSLISRKLTRKALDMIGSLAGEDEDTSTEGAEEGSAEEGKETTKKEKKESDKYESFWKEFGKSIKLGVLEDQRNKKKLLELLRFSTSKSPNTPISLKKYVENMKDGQKYIYYLSAASLDEAENSPFMERFRSKDIEVLYFVDNLDEYMNLADYDDYQIQSITKEGVELDGKQMKEYLQQKEEEFNELKEWLKNLYGVKISKVTISPTLSETPMAIVTAKHGYSAHMEKIAKAQAFGASMPMRATKILQINYRHPVIKELKERIANGESNDDNLKDYANLLLDTAFLKSGFDIEPDEQTEFAKRVERLIKNGLKLPLDAAFDPEPEFAKGLDMEEESGGTGANDEEEEEWTEDEKEEL
jgi:heat shock protein beta